MSWEGGRGNIFQAVEKGVDWCVPRSLSEEEVLGKVSGWVR